MLPDENQAGLTSPRLNINSIALLKINNTISLTLFLKIRYISFLEHRQHSMLNGYANREHFLFDIDSV